nr:hypothetical protein [Allomuricauda sp.]
MQNKQNTLLLGLQELAQEHFRTLTPQKHGFGLAAARVKGYQELYFYIEALLQVCILALDNQNSGNHPTIPQPDDHLQMVLQLAVQLLPLEEATFLDHMQTLLIEKEDPSK